MHIVYFDYFVVFVWIIEYGAAVNRSKRLPAQKVRTRKSPNQYNSLSENINDVIKEITRLQLTFCRIAWSILFHFYIF